MLNLHNGQGSKKHSSKALIPLPGYPWEGKFLTEEAIEDYFSGDRLICLLCGRTYVALGKHISMTHNVPLDTYKGRYGFPWRRGLIGQQHYAYLKGKAHKLRKQGQLLSGPPKGLQQIIKRRKPAKAPQPYHIKKSALGQMYKPETHEEALRRIKTGRTPRDVSFDDDMPCSTTINRYREQNPDYNQRYIQAVEDLPFHLQAKAFILGQRFKAEVLMLHRKKLTQEVIAQKLGVSTAPVQKAFSELGKEGRIVPVRTSKWIDQDFDEVLKRVACGQHPKQVCASSDVPGFSTWQKYLLANSEYQKRYKELIDSMPFPFQATCYSLGKRFEKEVNKLYQQGQTSTEISEMLEVSRATVDNHLPKVLKKKK